MFISVIIPTYNNNTELRLCLASLDAQSIGKDAFEVVVVDNGSKTPASEITQLFPFCRCVQESKPGSYNARNTGVEYAKGDILAFTDADCLPHSDWLKNSHRLMAQNPNWQAIGGDIEVTLSETPNSAEIYESIFSLKQRVYVTELGFAATANLIVRRDAFDATGHFDGGLLSGGDYDWSRRYAMAGGQLHFAPDVLVRHPARASYRGLVKKRRRVIGGRRLVDGRYPNHSSQRTINQQYGASQNLKLLMNSATEHVSLLRSWQVLAMKLSLGIVARYEKARLALGGTPLR